MQNRRTFNFGNSGNNNPGNLLWSVLLGIMVLAGLYFLARFIFRILYFLSPLIIIATLIIDHKVVINYGKWIISLFKQNIVFGIGATLLTIFGFPVVSTFLLGRALFNKRVKQAEQAFEQQTHGELVDFEELDSEPLRLPELDEEVSKRKSSGEYEDLF